MKTFLKTVMTLMLIGVIAFALYGCSADTGTDKDTTAPAETTAATTAVTAGEEDGQNPVMNYIGKYDNGGCVILVEADGMTGAKFTVDFPLTDSEAERYTFSGEWEEDTLKVHYNNSTKKVLKLAADGTVTEEKTEYTDGSGEIVFHEDGTLDWHDEKEAYRFTDNTTFSYVYVTE